jgi:hypothetical protein
MLDLHEGILLEFAERAVAAVEFDVSVSTASASAVNHKILRARRAASGLCVDCEDRAAPSRSSCPYHLHLRAASTSALKRRRRSSPAPAKQFTPRKSESLPSAP